MVLFKIPGKKKVKFIEINFLNNFLFLKESSVLVGRLLY